MSVSGDQLLAKIAAGGGGGGGPTAWDDIVDKPAVVAAGATQAAARTAIGAGTSNLTLAQSQAGIASKAAIAALTSESALEDVIAALQA